jgi:hypothetical protein
MGQLDEIPLQFTGAFIVSVVCLPQLHAVSTSEQIDHHHHPPSIAQLTFTPLQRNTHHH